jgi:hypothetical protein
MSTRESLQPPVWTSVRIQREDRENLTQLRQELMALADEGLLEEDLVKRVRSTSDVAFSHGAVLGVAIELTRRVLAGTYKLRGISSRSSFDAEEK